MGGLASLTGALDPAAEGSSPIPTIVSSRDQPAGCCPAGSGSRLISGLKPKSALKWVNLAARLAHPRP